MHSGQSGTGFSHLICTKDLSEFLNTTDGFARQLMKALDIPRRGKGYPRLRILAAFGFERPHPIHAPNLWSRLLDVPAVAKATDQSEKTIGRMFDGTHKDRSFTNFLLLGPRKRVIFPFEVEAWLLGITPEFVRKTELMHPHLRKESTPAPLKTKHQCVPSPSGTQQSAASLFLPPKPSN